MAIWFKIASLFKKSGKIQFKTHRQEAEWKKLTPKTREVALYASNMMVRVWGYTPMITSVYRTPQEQDALVKQGLGVKNSAHCFYRAVDFRWKDHPKTDGLVLADAINGKYPRKDKRPTAILHGENERQHLHIQTQA